MWLSMIPIAVVIPSHSMESSVRNLAMGSLEWAGSQIGNLSSTIQIKCRWGLGFSSPPGFQQYLQVAIPPPGLVIIIHLCYLKVFPKVASSFISCISFWPSGPLFCSRHPSCSWGFGSSIHNCWAHGSRYMITEPGSSAYRSGTKGLVLLKGNKTFIINYWWCAFVYESQSDFALCP